MENIRCFSKGTLALRPLTILLGENSTGKTTALACHQTSHELLGERNPDVVNSPFNQYPHSMGKYQDIVRKRISTSGSTGKTKKRVVLTHDCGQLNCKSFYFENEYGMVEIESLLLVVPGANQPALELRLSDDGRISKIEEHSPTKVALRIPMQLIFDHDMKQYLNFSVLPDIKNFLGKGDGSTVKVIDKIINHLSDTLPDHRLVSIPARKPEPLRKYELTDKEVFDGYDTFPQRLRKLQVENEKSYLELVSKIDKLGHASKTFDKFNIINETSELPYFMLMAERDGRQINMCDLGAGIWPALAQFIAVELELISGHGKLFHLQHLEGCSHPRLAAELVNWLCEKTNQGNNLIVETHSDYVLTRLTIEICEENVDPEDVAIAFFEHDVRNNRSVIHNLRYDEDGSVVEPPDCFQKFYLEETERYVLSSRKR